jgi:hypothetical protein
MPACGAGEIRAIADAGKLAIARVKRDFGLDVQLEP